MGVLLAHKKPLTHVSLQIAHLAVSVCWPGTACCSWNTTDTIIQTFHIHIHVFLLGCGYTCICMEKCKAIPSVVSQLSLLNLFLFSRFQKRKEKASLPVMGQGEDRKDKEVVRRGTESLLEPPCSDLTQLWLVISIARGFQA